MTQSLAERREVLMVENILRTELPQRTLDIIKQDRKSQRLFEFHIAVNHNGVTERQHLFTESYDDLRAWIVGINALIASKNSLMKLSSMIKS